MHRSKGDNVQEMLGPIGEVEKNWTSYESRAVFFHFLSTFWRSLFTKFGHDTWIHVSSKCFENVPFRGHLLQKPQNWRLSNRHLTQTTSLQLRGRTSKRYYCSLHVVVQGPGSFPHRLGFHAMARPGYCFRSVLGTKEGCHWQAGGENRQTWQLANPAWYT